jgi:glycosyltransferase involved in cell wall biosynthesis
MNIAVIGVGILPTVSTNGIPAFHAALRQMAEKHKVTVYSFIPVARNEPRIRVRCVSSRIPQRLQFLLLGLRFALDHVLNRFDIIHAQSPFPAGVLAYRLSNAFQIPWLLCFHAGEAAYMPEVPYGDLLNPFLKKINSKITGAARFVMAMSNHQAEMIKTNFHIDREIIVLPRGVKSRRLTEKIFSLPWKFIHVSYRQPVKGIDMTLNTIRYLSEHIPCELRIVGANYGKEFREEIARAGLQDKVMIEGALSHEKTIALIEKSDFLIHTSFCEGLPMVALEAMSCGTVVCGTAVGVMSDLSPVHCITVADRDHTELGRKILRACRERDFYSKIRRDAWEWTDGHNVTWYVNSLLSCYTKIIKAW